MSEVNGRIAGMDLGDDTSSVCILDAASGAVLEEARVRTRAKDVERYFGRAERMRVAIETGTHSPWVSRAIAACGHEVITANARKVRLVYAGMRKNDRLDAEKLARMARFDPSLLAPVVHRREGTQAHLGVLRAREALVRSRTNLINHVRGQVKSIGRRLPTCASTVFHRRAGEHMPSELAPALMPVVDAIATLTERIDALEGHIKRLAHDIYPECSLLMQVHGVAEITSLTYILTLENPGRFHHSRAVGAYLGLTPGQRQSGSSDPGRHITKEGDETLRRLLVQSAHRILGKRGADSDLRRHGLQIMRGGTKNAKRRAVIAVARKLAILLHALWSSGEVYEPLRTARAKPRLQQAA